MEAALEKKLSIDKTNWTPVKFGEVVFEPKESTKDPSADGIEHVVGLEHIEPENIHLKNSATLEVETTFSKKFAIGDVLFGRRRAYLKKAALASFNGICSGDITVFRAKENLTPNLLPFIVSNERFFDFAIKHSAGGLSPRVKFKDLANYELLLPPKNIQVELVNLFQALDNELTQNKILKEHLKHYSSAVFENIINNNYKGDAGTWKEFRKYKLKEVLAIPDKNKPNNINKENILSVRLHLKGVVKNKTVDGLKIGSTTYYIRKKGQFIYGKQNLFNGALGIVPDKLDGFLSSSDIPALDIDREKILPEYLMYYFGRKKFYKYLEKHSSGSGSKRIGEKKLLELEIILPKMKEQQEIINIMSKHSKAILNCEKKIRKTYALQKSLINQIF